MKKLLTLVALILTMCSIGFAQTCDTLFNLISDLDTATVYLADTGTGAGYLSGNNVYGDLMKAEGFASIPGDYVSTATLFFGIVTINPADSNKTVQIYVWDNTGTSIAGVYGSPGNVLDSTTVTLREIAAAVTATYNTNSLTGVLATFTGQAALTDTFYVGVVLPGVTGDTVALYTNEVPPGPDGNGWEYEFNYVTNSGNIWGSYNDDWGFTGGSEGNYIIADICGNVPVASFIPGDTTGCAPLTINFTDKSTQIPSNWSWTFGDGGTSTSQSPSYTFTTAGTYTVTERAINSNGVDSITSTITVQPSPVATLTATNASSASSDNGALSVSVTGGTQPYTYAWSDDSTGTSISNLATGTYSVTVTGQNTCATTASAVIAVTGINTLSNDVTIKIYPNPANDLLNFQWSLDAEADILIYDVTGNAIKSFTINGTAINSFDIHDLASGSYVIRVTDRQSNKQRSILFSKF